MDERVRDLERRWQASRDPAVGALLEREVLRAGGGPLNGALVRLDGRRIGRDEITGNWRARLRGAHYLLDLIALDGSTATFAYRTLLPADLIIARVLPDAPLTLSAPSLRAPCPVCGVKVGFPCRVPLGVHAERLIVPPLDVLIKKSAE